MAEHKTSMLKQLGVSLHEFSYLSAERRSEIIRKCMQGGEIRCFFCGRIMFCGNLGDKTSIQAKCSYHRCRRMNNIYIT
jgi:phage FluMu protein Com